MFLPCHKGKLTVFTGKFEIHKTGMVDSLLHRRLRRRRTDRGGTIMKEAWYGRWQVSGISISCSFIRLYSTKRCESARQLP